MPPFVTAAEACQTFVSETAVTTEPVGTEGSSVSLRYFVVAGVADGQLVASV